MAEDPNKTTLVSLSEELVRRVGKKRMQEPAVQAILTEIHEAFARAMGETRVDELYEIDLTVPDAKKKLLLAPEDVVNIRKHIAALNETNADDPADLITEIDPEIAAVSETNADDPTALIMEIVPEYEQMMTHLQNTDLRKSPAVAQLPENTMSVLCALLLLLTESEEVQKQLLGEVIGELMEFYGNRNACLQVLRKEPTVESIQKIWVCILRTLHDYDEFKDLDSGQAEVYIRTLRQLLDTSLVQLPLNRYRSAGTKSEEPQDMGT